MRAAWWAGAAAATALTALALYGAVAALAQAPDFDGVLRLVVEAVAGAVIIGYCIGRARRGASPVDDEGGGGTPQR